MKIGIDASRFVHDEPTGVEWYSHHIIKGILKLIGDDDEVILYSREPLKLKGAKNKVLKGRRFWTLLSLSKEMRKDPPDVLFVPSHTLPLTLPKRSVIMIHDTAFKHLRKAYSFLQYHYLNWSTKFAVKRASKILVPSEATAKDLVDLFGCLRSKIEVIPHGFAEPHLDPDTAYENSELFKHFAINRDWKYLLFVGRLERKKNLERLLAAFKGFLKKHPDYQLVLAGKRGVGFKSILKKAHELQIMDNVLMPGYITEEEKAALFAGSQAFVFPSLYEGFGLPILEAFYYGKPVVCSDNSALPEVAGKAAVMVDAYDPKSIQNGLEKVVEDEQYVKELIEAGTKRLGHFSWKEAARKTLKVIHGQ